MRSVPKDLWFESPTRKSQAERPRKSGRVGDVEPLKVLFQGRGLKPIVFYYDTLIEEIFIMFRVG